MDRVVMNDLAIPVVDGKFVEYEYVNGASDVSIKYYCGDQLVGADNLPITAPASLKLRDIAIAVDPPVLGTHIVPVCLGLFVDDYTLPLDVVGALPTVSGSAVHADGMRYFVDMPGTIDLECEYDGMRVQRTVDVLPGPPAQLLTQIDGSSELVIAEAGETLEVQCSGADARGGVADLTTAFVHADEAASQWLDEDGRFTPEIVGTYQLECRDHRSAGAETTPIAVEVRPGAAATSSIMLERASDGAVHAWTKWYDAFGNQTTGEPLALAGWTREPGSDWQPAAAEALRTVMEDGVHVFGTDAGSAFGVSGDGEGDPDGPARILQADFESTWHCQYDQALAPGSPESVPNMITIRNLPFPIDPDDVDVFAHGDDVTQRLIDVSVEPDYGRGPQTISWNAAPVDLNRPGGITWGWSAIEIVVSSDVRNERFVYLCSQETYERNSQLTNDGGRIGVVRDVTAADARFAAAQSYTGSDSDLIERALVPGGDIRERLERHAILGPMGDEERPYARFDLGRVAGAQVTHSSRFNAELSDVRITPLRGCVVDFEQCQGRRRRRAGECSFTHVANAPMAPEIATTHSEFADRSGVELGASISEPYFTVAFDSLTIAPNWSPRFSLELTDIVVAGSTNGSRVVVPYEDAYQALGLADCDVNRTDAEFSSLLPRIGSTRWVGKAPRDVRDYLGQSRSRVEYARDAIADILLPAVASAMRTASVDADALRQAASTPGFAWGESPAGDTSSPGGQRAVLIQELQGVPIDQNIPSRWPLRLDSGALAQLERISTDNSPLAASQAGMGVRRDVNQNRRNFGNGIQGLSARLATADVAGLTAADRTSTTYVVDFNALNAALEEMQRTPFLEARVLHAAEPGSPLLSTMTTTLPPETRLDVALGGRSSLEPTADGRIRATFSGITASVKIQGDIDELGDSGPQQTFDGTVWFDVDVVGAVDHGGRARATVEGLRPVPGTVRGFWRVASRDDAERFVRAAGEDAIAPYFADAGICGAGVCQPAVCPPDQPGCSGGVCDCEGDAMFCTPNLPCRPYQSVDFAGLGLYPWNEMGYVDVADDVVEGLVYETLVLTRLEDALTERVAAIGAVAVDRLLTAFPAPIMETMPSFDSPALPTRSTFLLRDRDDLLAPPQPVVDFGLGAIRFDGNPEWAFRECDGDADCVCEPSAEAECVSSTMVCDDVFEERACVGL